MAVNSLPQGHYGLQMLLAGWLVALAGCAMCGACYDECYPGYPGTGVGGDCQGPRAGSVRAMGIAKDGDPSVVGQFPSDYPEEQSQALETRSQQEVAPDGETPPNGPMAFGPAPQWKGAARGYSAAGNLSQPIPSGGRVPNRSGQYLAGVGVPARDPSQVGPLGWLTYWLTTPPHKRPQQRSFGQRLAPGSYSFRQTNPMGRDTRATIPLANEAGVVARNAPGIPGRSSPGASAISYSTPQDTRSMAGGEKVSAVPSPRGMLFKGGRPLQVAEGTRRGRWSWPTSTSASRSGPGSQPPAGIPADVWAAIPPEDRATAQILSITDRKLEPGGAPAEGSSLVGGSGSGGQGSLGEPGPLSSDGLQWLPVAPWPPGTGP